MFASQIAIQETLEQNLQIKRKRLWVRRTVIVDSNNGILYYKNNSSSKTIKRILTLYNYSVEREMKKNKHIIILNDKIENITLKLKFDNVYQANRWHRHISSAQNEDPGMHSSMGLNITDTVFMLMMEEIRINTQKARDKEEKRRIEEEEMNLEADLKCKICLEEIEFPVRTNCCHQTFCSKCVIFHKAETNNGASCPLCRKWNYSSDICPKIQNILNEQEEICPHEGCQHTSNALQMRDHRVICQSRQFNCCKEGCLYVGCRDDMILHVFNHFDFNELLRTSTTQGIEKEDLEIVDGKPLKTFYRIPKYSGYYTIGWSTDEGIIDAIRFTAKADCRVTGFGTYGAENDDLYSAKYTIYKNNKCIEEFKDIAFTGKENFSTIKFGVKKEIDLVEGESIDVALDLPSEFQYYFGEGKGICAQNIPENITNVFDIELSPHNTDPDTTIDKGQIPFITYYLLQIRNDRCINYIHINVYFSHIYIYIYNKLASILLFGPHWMDLFNSPFHTQPNEAIP